MDRLLRTVYTPTPDTSYQNDMMFMVAFYLEADQSTLIRDLDVSLCQDLRRRFRDFCDAHGSAADV